MRKSAMLLVVMIMASMLGCGSSKEKEFKDTLTKMQVAGAEFDVAIERFRKLSADEQTKAVESAKATLATLVRNRVTADLKKIMTAAECYCLKASKPPTVVSDLVGPDNYLKELPRDPWGNEYKLEVEGGVCNAICAGPDGVFGTGDDIRL